MADKHNDTPTPVYSFCSFESRGGGRLFAFPDGVMGRAFEFTPDDWVPISGYCDVLLESVRIPSPPPFSDNSETAPFEFSFYLFETKPGGRLFASEEGTLFPALEFKSGAWVPYEGVMGTLWKSRPIPPLDTQKSPYSLSEEELRDIDRRAVETWTAAEERDWTEDTKKRLAELKKQRGMK